MEKENYRLFQSLKQQLAYEVIFVKNVSKTYKDVPNKLDIVDFEYKGRPCKLVLNGKITLETKQHEVDVESFQDLLQGLIHSNNNNKSTKR